MPLKTSLVRFLLSNRVRAMQHYATDYETLQRNTLRKLVRQARDTVWGQEHDYAHIRDYPDFTCRVPVGGYASLKPYITRMMQGEKDVLWKGAIRRFAHSSGTSSDTVKIIPVSPQGLKRCHLRGGRDVTASYLHTHPHARVASGHSLIISGSFNKKYSTPRVGDISAIMADAIPSFFRRILGFVPSKDALQIQDFHSKMDHVLGQALPLNVSSMSGTPDWYLVFLQKALERKGAHTVEEIWPNLEVFAHGGMSFDPYRTAYRKLFPSGKICYIENYNATEGFFGIQTDPSDPAMTLMLDYEVFYEFLPLNAGENARPLPLWEVETDTDYALIVSTSSGLWRYNMEDVLRFTQKAPYKFVLRGRTQQFLSIWGEDLFVQQADKALAQACARTGACVVEYTVAPSLDPESGKGFHQWLIEFSQDPPSLPAFEALLEQCVREYDFDYQHITAQGELASPLQVIVARRGLFYEWMDSRGKLGGQHKVPRLSSSRKYMDELLSL